MRIFATIPAKPYIGALFSRPVNICKPLAGNLTQNAVVASFIWLNYQGALNLQNVGGVVDVKNGLASNTLDQIKSVYVDNLGSDVPVYINFPDTNFTVACKPGAAGWFPVFTLGLVANVFAEGLTPGDLSQTLVLFANFNMVPYLDSEVDQTIALYKASRTITRGTTIYNQDYGTPALGDQTFQAVLNFAAASQTAALWGTPLASGFIYLTELWLLFFGSNITDAGASAIDFQAYIESTGLAGTLYQFGTVAVPIVGITNRSLLLYNATGLNLKLDATQTWRLRVTPNPTVATGAINFVSTFTTNPL